MRRRANGEGSVYYDAAKENWVAAVSIDGRRIKRSAKTKKEAVELKKKLDRDAEAQRGTKQTDADTAWLLDQWERLALTSKDSAPATIETKRWALRHLHEQLGRTRLSRLGYSDVERALNRLAADPHNLSQQSLVKIRSTLNQVCEWGLRRGHLRMNPARAAEIPARAKRPKDIEPFSVIQTQQLLATAKDDVDLYGIVCVMLSTGLRPGEARALRWDAWNPADATVAVRATIRVIERQMTVVQTLKTTSSRRTIKVPTEAAAAIEKVRAKREARGLGTNPLDLIFSTATGKPLDPSSFRRMFAALCDRAGVPDHSPNTLRHTCASLLSDTGVAAERLADLLGHRDTRMVLRTYRKILAPSLDTAVSPMSALLA